jgi:hypothetical protein
LKIHFNKPSWFFIHQLIITLRQAQDRNKDEELPDCTGNPFGAHGDSILINFPAKRLKGKAGTNDEVRTKVDSPS